MNVIPTMVFPVCFFFDITKSSSFTKHSRKEKTKSYSSHFLNIKYHHDMPNLSSIHESGNNFEHT